MSWNGRTKGLASSPIVWLGSSNRAYLGLYSLPSALRIYLSILESRNKGFQPYPKVGKRITEG
jgi:hypothetical protein